MRRSTLSALGPALRLRMARSPYCSTSKPSPELSLCISPPSVLREALLQASFHRTSSSNWKKRALYKEGEGERERESDAHRLEDSRRARKRLARLREERLVDLDGRDARAPVLVLEVGERAAREHLEDLVVRLGRHAERLLQDAARLGRGRVRARRDDLALLLDEGGGRGVRRGSSS